MEPDLLRRATQILGNGSEGQIINETFERLTGRMDKFVRRYGTWNLPETVGRPFALSKWFGSEPIYTPLFPVASDEASVVTKGWGIEIRYVLGANGEEYTGQPDSIVVDSILQTNFHNGGVNELMIPGSRVIWWPDSPNPHADTTGTIIIKELVSPTDPYVLFHEQGHLANGLSEDVVLANIKVSYQDYIIGGHMDFDPINLFVGLTSNYSAQGYDIGPNLTMPFGDEDYEAILGDEIAAHQFALARLPEFLGACMFDKNRKKDGRIRELTQMRYLEIVNSVVAVRMSSLNTARGYGSVFDLFESRFGSDALAEVRGRLGI